MSSIWFNNIEVLFNKDNFTQIIPTKEMSFEEKINSITRFALYLSIILYLVSGNYLYIYIFVITIIVFYLVYVFGGKELFQGNIISSTPTETTGTTGTISIPTISTSEKIPCKEPTTENPLMNLMATDNYHQSLPACLTTDIGVKSKIDQKLIYEM